MDIKACFFDIDGTLLDHVTGQIFPSTLQAITQLRNKGILVYIATGRIYSMVCELGLDIDSYFDGVIACNGQLILIDNIIHFKNPIHHKDIVYIIETAKQHDIPIVYSNGFNQYASFINETLIKGYTSLNIPVPSVKEITHSEVSDVLHLVVFIKKEQEKLFNDMEHSQFVRWNIDGVDVIRNNTNKSTAVHYLMHQQAIDLQNVIAFGDGLNDLEMIEMVGIGVAMGNGHNELKKAANYITASSDQEGIYQFLSQKKII